MKNKGLYIVIISVVIVVLISILYVLSLKNIDSELLNNKWYHYDKATGYTDMLLINDEQMKYYKSGADNYTDEYSFCSSYKYSKKDKTITFDCNKRIIINNIYSNKLFTTIDDNEIIFFKNINDSIQYEFQKYYGKTIEEYRKSKKQTLEIIQIEPLKVESILNDNDYSKIIFIGDNCNKIECSLVYDIIEKWISYSKNIFYVDSNTIDNNTILKLNKIESKFSLELRDYNDIYPLVYVVNNKRLVDKYKIACNGFNCSSFYNK